ERIYDKSNGGILTRSSSCDCQMVERHVRIECIILCCIRNGIIEYCRSAGDGRARRSQIHIVECCSAAFCNRKCSTRHVESTSCIYYFEFSTRRSSCRSSNRSVTVYCNRSSALSK